ncbi:uncharacterized protein LACBIDRAFT_302243 [Laccaria bicolor S238N-H82]|uniref:Predicted protein n=1 Tax=Laccaria bicolor (strain S238N-H82 / ATCC MYA-4686) TaxID=486041 RepID=B0DHD8_LACBS|nr:uncharacterized protein LACBIDRAFT_302243 [Laccaria bicolor S238N-H82]EDR05999.1 predicted protein [Laccaria bicolor S238N-H82]|eukprot:XP_001883287.1 predicted protein [Laccaria bicolor S238N-H82]
MCTPLTRIWSVASYWRRLSTPQSSGRRTSLQSASSLANERVAVDFPADSDRLQLGFRRHQFTSDRAITWQLQQLLPPSSLDCRNGSSLQLPRLISAANFIYVGSHAPSLAYPLITGEIASGSMFFGGMSSGRHAIDHTFSTTVAHFATVS